VFWGGFIERGDAFVATVFLRVHYVVRELQVAYKHFVRLFSHDTFVVCITVRKLSLLVSRPASRIPALLLTLCSSLSACNNFVVR
jgi:hypothetical protein